MTAKVRANTLERGSIRCPSPPDRRGDDSPGRPSDSDALAALRVLRSWLGLAAPVATVVFTSAQLPPEVASADAFARIHRAQVRSGVAGWCKAGSVRSVTAEAWREYLDEQTARARGKAKRVPPGVHRDAKPANDVADAELDRALGVRRRSASGR